jgi:hypothetical protein
VYDDHEESTMPMRRPAVAVAVVLWAGIGAARAGELLPADRPIALAVDHYLELVLKAERVTPAPDADQATLVRRLTLDLAGRIPTAAESRAYVESTDPAKRAQLVDRLIASPGFALHQVAELDAMLMAGNRGTLRDYLVRAVGENRSWDRLFRELLLPERTDQEKSAASQYLRTRVMDLDRLTAEVSSTFFGVNISCAQCHDHPLVKDWKQDHFYGMKAFLNRTYATGRGNNAVLAERGQGSLRYKTTEGVERQAKLMFLTGRTVEEPAASRELSKEERKAEKERLQRAQKEKAPAPPPKFSARAKLVEIALEPGDRDFFARAIVNRLWHRLFGRGLVMPLDQMHSANPPSHPELLEWLARDTIEHGYDLRRLIRGLVLSRAYSRSSRWDGDESPRPSLFAVAVLRPLSPAQLARSLRLATADPASLPAGLDAPKTEKRIEALETGAGPIEKALGASSGEGQIGVAEALLFSNGKTVAQDLLSESTGLVRRLRETADPELQIELAVRNVLSRPPDDEDRRILGAYLANRTDRPEDGCRQLLWALLTCAEFRFNH